jgi:hypothetical protein
MKNERTARYSELMMYNYSICCSIGAILEFPGRSAETARRAEATRFTVRDGFET